MHNRDRASDIFCFLLIMVPAYFLDRCNHEARTAPVEIGPEPARTK